MERTKASTVLRKIWDIPWERELEQCKGSGLTSSSASCCFHLQWPLHVFHLPREYTILPTLDAHPVCTAGVQSQISNIWTPTPGNFKVMTPTPPPAPPLHQYSSGPTISSYYHNQFYCRPIMIKLSAFMKNVIKSCLISDTHNKNVNMSYGHFRCDKVLTDLVMRGFPSN